MTPKERAEKIWDAMEDNITHDINLIAAQIAEAEREARLSERQKFPCCCESDRPCPWENKVPTESK